MNNHTLYLCYFGLREPLVQTQVLPYLREIAKGGITVSLLTFEADFKQKWTREQIETERAKLVNDAIDWNCLPYHKSPSVPATLYDVIQGARFARRMIAKNGVNVVHARAHIPLLMALIARNFAKFKLIFDIRGLMAEEYVDAGTWKPDSKPFKMIKKVERAGLNKANQIVVLTERMKNYLVENDLRKADSIEVIPCCFDFARGESDNVNIAKSERFELIYAGTATGLYMLEEMAAFFLALKRRKPDAFFRLLTVSPRETVKAVFDKLQINPQDYEIQAVKPAEVPSYLRKAHLAISFRKPTFSQIAASPTKIPEYLACGVAVVANSGIGDSDQLLIRENVGVIVENFDEATFEKAADDALNLLRDDDLAKRCVETALTNFDLKTVGGKRYLKVYERATK